MKLGDFQLCLREHDPDLYLALREVWDPIELNIRKAIPSGFEFGGVKKIVLELGPDETTRPRYRELLDVGLLHYPEFDPKAYLLLEPPDQARQTIDIIEACMSELASRFETRIDWLKVALDDLQ